MGSYIIKPISSFSGKINIPGDKSIACRAVIISAITKAKTSIKNFPANEDCFYTIELFKRLGIKITKDFNKLQPSIAVFGKGLYGLNKPKSPIFAGDSGTAFRLVLGVLAGQGFRVNLTAGKSLSLRPMRRVTEPLRLMGAKIDARLRTQDARNEEYPPLTIIGTRLKPILYKIPVASAQVKSAILLAGLYASGRTKVIESIRTRDHTERMLKLFKADLKLLRNTIVIKGQIELVSPHKLYIPGDISSASFFFVLASILPNSKVLIKNVGLNPSRLGVIRVLGRMGANIRVASRKSQVTSYEPMGDLVVGSSILKGIKVKRTEIPSLIDELPILMVAACYAEGETIFEGVSELRVKETDRIRSMSENLCKMGASIKIVETCGIENIVIRGVKELVGTKVRSFGDHRTAMSMIIAGLKAKGRTIIDDIGCINKSFPNFLAILNFLSK
jgi:3-phosphoshikimate 1-carboxyvinyltransferase